MSERDLLDAIDAAFVGVIADGALGFVDDVAHLPAVASGHTRVTTVDMVVEGRDFDLSRSPPSSVGHRLVVQNLSDLASAGATPVGFVWSLALPKAFVDDVDALRSFMTGAAAAAKAGGMPMFGGDLSSTTGPLMASLTAFGDVAGPPLRRDTASAGDVLYVSRALGASGAGLRHLLDDQHDHACVQTHEFPTAETTLGPALVGVATSCMDISDSFAKDLHRLCRASGLGAVVDTLPVADGADLDDALFGGEDYALLFTCRPGVAPPAGTAIGVVTAGHDVTWQGQPLPARGWDHF